MFYLISIPSSSYLSFPLMPHARELNLIIKPLLRTVAEMRFPDLS